MESVAAVSLAEVEPYAPRLEAAPVPQLQAISFHLPPVAIGAILLFVVCTALSLVHVHAVDYPTLRWMNSISGRWYLLDHGIGNMVRMSFSNVLLVSMLWYVWFCARRLRQRACLMLGTVVTLLSTGISRVLQHVLPAHARPLLDPQLGFHTLPFINPAAMNHWSSYPSDHAVMFYGLAATMFYVHPRVGRLAYFTAALLSLTRVYLGFHSPTDVLGGAALGILCVELTRPLASLPSIRRLVPAPEQVHPAFYALAFYFCFGFCELFTDQRETLASIVHYLHHGAH